MSQSTINQRLIFLLNVLGMKAGSFSRALGVSETTVRNYLDRNSKPSSDILEKIYSTFSQVNLVWLITGEGEPLLADVATQATISGDKNALNGGAHSHATISDCEKERDTYKVERDQARQEVAHLQAQLVTKDALIASKDETIAVLKAANRPGR